MCIIMATDSVIMVPSGNVKTGTWARGFIARNSSVYS